MTDKLFRTEPGLNRLGYIIYHNVYMDRYLISHQGLVKSCKTFFREAKNNKESREILVNTGWQLFEKVVRLCLALISGILIARYLQPEQYGVYNYALAFISFFAAVSNLGSNQIVVKDLVQEPEHRQEIVSTAIALRLFSGISLSILASGISLVFIEDKTVQILVIIFSLQMIFRASEAIEFFFQSRMEFKWIACARNLAAGVATVLLVLAIIKDQSIFVLAVISSVEFLASLLFLSAIYIKQNHFFSLAHISLSRLKSILRASWPLIFSGIAITVYMRVDQLMISSMSGNAELGLYSAVVRLTE
ncbi:MAG: flippase, partial [Phormidesmis sp.]